MNSSREPKKILENPNFISFLISGTLVAVIFTSFSLVDDLGKYFLQLLPGMLGILVIQVLTNECFGNNQDCQPICYVVIGILSFFSFPIFLGVFFGIFHPLHSLSYEKVDNCQVIGVAPMAQPAYEVYTLLYVNFEYNNQQLLGYACTSDQVQNSQNYSYIFKGDHIICDNVGKSYDTPYNKRLRMLHTIQDVEDDDDEQTIINEGNMKQLRSLRQRGNCQQGGKSKYSYYNFSNLKIPSWMCMQRNSETFEQLTSVRSCYVNFQTDRERSLKNAQDRLNQREVYFFAQVEFSIPVYFPEAGLYCLIVFTFYPINMLVYPLVRFIFELLIEHFNKSYTKIK